jgi:hypothetical protein
MTWGRRSWLSLQRMVGIEMQRVQHCRVRWPIHQFPDGPQSGSHGAHVSASPPLHLGRRDFPDPVGDVTFPMKPSHSARRLKHWPAFLGAHQVCFIARHARLQRRCPATVCRLRRAACPSLPRAPSLGRHCPPSSLLWAHARILWPLSSFDLRSALESLCRLDQPRLVHRTVPALTSALSKSVAPPAPRVRSVRLTVSSRATAAFTERVAARQPLVVPQHGFVRGEFTALQAFHNVATLSFACPSDRSHGTTRGKDFVVRASIGVVTALHAGPATRLNRSIVAADLSSARSDVLLAAHSFIHNISPVSTGARRPP